MGEAISLIDLLSTGGNLTLLAIIILGALREWWFTGAAFQRMKLDRDEWKALALDSMQTTDRAVELAEK